MGDSENEFEEDEDPVFEALRKVDPSTRRLIKTHLPFELLPPCLFKSGCKIVYVARNPRDVAISFYHFSKLVRAFDFQGSFEEYWEVFAAGSVPFAPHLEHVKDGWNHRHFPNVLFLFYEDLNRDIHGAIKRVSNFLGKTITTEETQAMAEHLNIKNFRNNSSVNLDMEDKSYLNENAQPFIRKGRSDIWSEEYTPDLKEKALKWIRENEIEYGAQFPVEY